MPSSQNVIAFPISKPSAIDTNKLSMKPRMLRCTLPPSTPLPRKVERLQRTRPVAASLVEELVDRLLDEVS